jgi:Skp family chaperone for outer membrane proteins
MRTRWINYALWGAFLLALASSIQHLAYTFATVEWIKELGWVPALAVDATLAALAYSIRQRKRLKKPVRALWGGVAFLAFISTLANLYHALSVESGAPVTVASLQAVDWLQFAKALVLSATLPAMVIYLGEVVSEDDAQAAVESERQAERERAKAEREQKRADTEAERAATQAKTDLLAAENEARRLALAEQEARERQARQAQQAELANQHTCPVCERSFLSQKALNAHMAAHKAEPAPAPNGRAH